MRRIVLAFLAFCFTLPSLASDRVPGDRWMAYADPAQAGFDVERLAAAEAEWRGLPSSAFMVIVDGAVVANWGDTQRRFMCHSVRKSFLSGLYGIYWDRGEIELNKTVGEIGIDEEDGLLESEKQARILDLLKARSGVFHPAAYAGRTDSRPRGSEGPGRYFAYNNWDFNTLAAILTQETGADVFEGFDQFFGQPLQMQDWRVSDGYYHYQRNLSVYPAYPFRLSARDAARFGLLYTRDGRWGDQEILSKHWVQRSTALYSIDSDVYGYGFMWWIAREPRFAPYGLATALGVGNQMIAILPELDMVIVNRANTYEGEGTPQAGLLDLIESVLEARKGEPVENPKLVSLDDAPLDPRLAPAEPSELDEFVGDFPYPPAVLGLPERTRVQVRAEGDHLVTYSEVSGTFATYLAPDGWLIEEDSFDRYLPLRDADGKIAGLADSDVIADAAAAAAADGNFDLARSRMELIASEESAHLAVARILLALYTDPGDVDGLVAKTLESYDPREIEGRINGAGYQLLGSDRVADAQKILELNTQIFPEAFNTWDSLGEVHLLQGHHEEAIQHYQKSLELNPDNSNATTMIDNARAALAGKKTDSE